jgi:hypothetical protein
MSDLEVLTALDRLERLLKTPLEHSATMDLTTWQAEFDQAAGAAERGPRWPEVLLRAKVLGVLLSRRVALLQASQRSLKQKLARNATGRKALSAYQVCLT